MVRGPCGQCLPLACSQSAGEPCPQTGNRRQSWREDQEDMAAPECSEKHLSEGGNCAGARRPSRSFQGRQGLGGGRGADVATEVTGEILALWDHVLNSDCITGDF